MIGKALPIIFVIFSFYQEVFTQDLFISNLNNTCLRCLCIAASNCDLNFGCQSGLCGPFLLGKAYYLDAVKSTDMDTSDEAFEKCALDYSCAKTIVKHYIARFARDCNQDGVTNCMDYAMINFNGGYGCELDLNRGKFSRQYAERYRSCNV